MSRRVVSQKMIEWSLWALWGLLLGGAVLWLLVGSVAYWVRWGWLPADTSGWVQALGTLGAIAVAVAVPIYQRAQDRKERERARLEQLSALCSEALEVVSDLDSEAAFADYDMNNSLRRTVLSDLLQRINEAQLGELNAERMKIGVRLRFMIYDWLKYFAFDKEVDLGRLHDRVSRKVPKFEMLDIDAKNLLRRHQGLPDLNYPLVRDNQESQDPW